MYSIKKARLLIFEKLLTFYFILLFSQLAPKVRKKGYMNLNISTDEEKDEPTDEESEEEEKSAYEDDSDFEES